MRLLADENFPRKAVELLRERGHDVMWAHTEMPGATDALVISFCVAEKRVLVTQDKDFGELVFAQGWEKSVVGVILFRLAAPSPTALAARMVAVLDAGIDFAGQFAVVDDARIRLRSITGEP